MFYGVTSKYPFVCTVGLSINKRKIFKSKEEFVSV